MISLSEIKTIKNIFPYTSPENIPLSFICGGKKITGIPKEFNPRTIMLRPDTNITQYIIEGSNASGLTIRAEYIEYRDYPGTEWVVYFTNNGNENSEVISDIKVIDGIINGTNPILIHSNGDNCQPSGYEVYTDALTEKITKAPTDGTSCNGASPYMTLIFNEFTTRIGIGWPAQWEASFEPAENGIHITCGQKRCNMYIKPGETMRTPRINFVSYIGDEDHGRQVWRNWYMKHIMPLEDGKKLTPKLCLHGFAENGPEFTGATEEAQLEALETYVKRGLKPDIWWIDAGWYKCDFNWPHTGTWAHDIERFPNGLRPIGEKCEEYGTKFLLWFEPERVVNGTELDLHDGWVIHKNGENDQGLLDYSNPDALDFIIERINALIDEYKVTAYRQDFNYCPLQNWIDNETADRIGAIENLHVQGYLKLWDSIILRHPGMWLDSCASGGRRNDLETMRRAVPLHYTDVGYGNPEIKQIQHRYMFEWIPFFRAHNMSWDNGDGAFEIGEEDAFAYHCALAPSLTDMVNRHESDTRINFAIKMTSIWRRAADLMLRGDYYPLSECRRSREDYYAMQFEDTSTQDGFIQIVRNPLCPLDSFTAKMKADNGFVYHFENPETSEAFELDGADICSNGFTVSIPKRSGVIYFYSKVSK